MGVPFHLESISAQDSVDSGDKKPWSVLSSQIGEVNCNEVEEWLKGVEYTMPCPPKKPGGCVTDQRQLSLVLSLVLFLGSCAFLAAKSQNKRDSTWFPPRAPWSLCVGG